MTSSVPEHRPDPAEAAHRRRWRQARGIGEPDPDRSRTHSRLPAGVVAHCDELLSRPRGPALLALVVMGKISPAQIDHVRHLSTEVDVMYDEAEADTLARHADTLALMRNDLADAQLRERHRRHRRGRVA